MTALVPNERIARVVVGGAGSLAGATAMATAGLHPVGSMLLDTLWSGAAGALLTLAISRTSPRVWLLLAFLGAGATQTWLAAAIVAIIGAIALAFEFDNRDTDRLVPGLTVGLLTTAFLARLPDFGVTYLSAVLTAVVATTAGASALRSLPKSGQKALASLSCALVAGLTILAALGASGLNETRSSVSAGEAHARRAVAALNHGDFAAAAASVRQANAEVRAVHSTLSTTRFDLIAALPGAGPNVKVLRETTEGLDGILEAAETLLDQSDQIDGIFSDGQIDLDRLTKLERSAREVSSAGLEMQDDLKNPSVWLVPDLRTRLDGLLDRVEPASFAATELQSSDDVSLAEMLGEDEARRYLVLFGNPAEARELGGFAGATALIEFVDGSVEVVRADRPRVLNDSPSSFAELSHPVPQRFLEHRPWMFSQNFTAMADLPTLAQAIADLYPTMGNSQINGVIYLDPSALAALLSITGPVQVPGVDEPISSDTIEEVLTVDQYEMFERGHIREQFLVDLLDASLSALVGSDLTIGPDQLKLVANAVHEDRLLLAPIDPDELAVFDALGTSGRIGEIDGDYLAVSHLNGGPNKLDAYLHRSVDYRVDFDPETGDVSASVEIVVENRAPTDLSEYAAANNHDYPFGTNRLTLVVHTPHEALLWEGGDEPELSRSFREFDRWRHERVVVVPAGESRTVRLLLSGDLPAHGDSNSVPGTYLLDVGHQPLVTTDSVSVSISNGSGSSFLLHNDTRLDLQYSTR